MEGLRWERGGEKVDILYFQTSGSGGFVQAVQPSFNWALLHPGMKLIFRDGRVRKRQERLNGAFMFVCVGRQKGKGGRSVGLLGA